MSDPSERAIEFRRQFDETRNIGRIISDLVNDMCRSRRVNFDLASTELMTLAISMSKNFHNNVHQDLIDEHGESNIRNFDDAFSDAILKKLLLAGEYLSEDTKNPAVFGILSGDNLSNQKLAQALLVHPNFSVEYVTEQGFYVGIVGDFFKIRVSVHGDAISFFDYFDDPDKGIEENILACGKFNSETNFSKAQIVNSGNLQIHFNYILPHSGSVFIKDVERVIVEFIDEQKKKVPALW